MGTTIVTLAKYKIKHKSYLGRLVLLNFLFLFFKWTALPEGRRRLFTKAPASGKARRGHLTRLRPGTLSFFFFSFYRASKPSPDWLSMSTFSSGSGVSRGWTSKFVWRPWLGGRNSCQIACG